MKKSSKKLLGLGTSLLIGSAGVIAGISVLKVNKLESIVNQNVVSRSVQNDGFELDNHDSFSLSNNLNNNNSSNKTINAETPNVTKPVPKGYVTVDKGNKLICLDKNNPNNILWYHNYSSSTKHILAVEYTPMNDTLVVLNSDKDSSGKISVFIDKYSSISLRTGGVEYSPDNRQRVFQDYYEDSFPVKVDGWALSPVYKTSSESNSGQVTDYIVYPKVNNTKKSGSKLSLTIFEYSINANNIQSKRVSYNDYVDQKQIIMGMSSWFFQGKTHLVTLVLRESGLKTKVFIDYFVSNNSEYKLINSKIANGINDNTNLLNLSEEVLYKIAKSNISGSAFKYISSSKMMTITFALNVWREDGYSSNFHRNTKLITVSILCENEKFTNENVKVINLWSETWNGYFDNSVIAAKGLNHSSLSPLVLEGYDYDLMTSSNDSYYGGRFVAVIDDSTILPNNYTFKPTTSLNDSNWRIYMQYNEEGVNKTGSKYYSGVRSSINPYSNNELDVYQGALGIPILEYNGASNYNVFNLNILFLKNGSDRGIIINQKDRTSNTQNLATYGYYTSPGIKNVSFDFSSQVNSIDVSNVNVAYLNSLLKIGESVTNWKDSTFLTSNLKMKNVRSEAKFLIKEDTINRDFIKGSVSFDLYSTIVYTNIGVLSYKTIDEIKSNWIESNKIGKFTITGFKQVKATTIENFKIDKDLRSAIDRYKFAPPMVPSEVVKNIYGSNVKESFLNLLWQSICNQKGFTNLKQIPKYNSKTWKNDMGAFFINYNDILNNAKFDNANGKVILNVKVSKNYAIPTIDNSDNYVSFDNWEISGLRRVGATEFISNTKETAFINSSWSNKNIPYDNSSLDTVQNIIWPNYVDSSVVKITENEIKLFLFNSLGIGKAYGSANASNQYYASSEWIKNVPYWITYGWQSTGDYWDNINHNHIAISGFRYYPHLGKMKVDVRLKIWNQNDERIHWTTDADMDGQVGTENIFGKNVPKGTFWIGGFKTDNVTTFVNTTDNWELDLNNVPVGEFDNQKYISLVNKAIVEQGTQKQYLKFPYWVNLDNYKSNDYKDLISYEKMGIVDVTQGIAKVKIKFKNNYWYAKNDGSVEEAKNEQTQDVIIKGFRAANPISIDSSQFFNISNNLLSNNIYLDPIIKSTDFVNWLKNTENKIIEYVVEQDKKANPNGSLSKEQWQNRLKFKYSIDDTNNESFVFTVDNIFDEINKKLMTKTGKLWFMYSDDFKNGFKLWVKINDLEPDSPYILEDKTTNNEKGTNLRGLLNTQKVVLQLNMNNWIQNLKTNRGTIVEGLNEQNSTVESIKPPLLNESTYGSNMEFSEIETFLKSIGYHFNFEWKDSTGKKQSSETLPTKFSYDSENPIIKVSISYDKNKTPSVYIFNDNSHSINSVDTFLSLAVKKVFKIDYSFFESMYQHWSVVNKNIVIDTNGNGDSSTIQVIKNSWSQFEQQYWSLNNLTNKDEYKQNLEIAYSINGSEFIYNSESMWTEINRNWINATKNIDEIGKLRFYSPKFVNGTKIQVKIMFKQSVNLEYNAIEYKDNKQQVIVNHKLSTTFDMDKYSKFWSTTKSETFEGSTFNDLKGFTPATYNNVTFDKFEKTTSQQLGLLIEYSNDNKKWYSSRQSITSVNEFNPIVYMRFSSKIDDYDKWGNNFEIKNFSTGTTNTTSNDVNLKWSSGVELHLNLPKYLQLKPEWISEFISSNPLSGNTKYLNINENSEKKLIQQIVDGNEPYQDSKPTVWLEYRLGANGRWDKRSEFIKNLRESNVDSTTNLIQFKINVNPINIDEPIYAVKENKYEISNNIKIFINKSYENEASNVLVSGTNDKFTYNYAGLPVNDKGIWTGEKGLQIQWTTDKTATYNDRADDSKWNSSQINSFNPVDRYLAIRIIAKDGYVYSASYTENDHNPNPHADIHVVNVENIKSKIEVDLNELKTLNLSGYVHELNLDQLLESEKQILSKINGGNNLAIHYQVFLADGKKLNGEWIDATKLKSILNNYSMNYNNVSQGLIKFKVNGVSSIPTASINATFVSNDSKFIPIDKNNIDLNQGIETNTTNVKTKVDLSSWHKVLKTKPTSFEVGSTSNNIRGIVPPGMDGAQGSAFLAGMQYAQIVELLKTIGLDAQFKAPGSSTQDNWVSLDKINNLNNANELYIRFQVISDFANSVEVWTDSKSAQDNSNPDAIKLVINLPITLKVSIEKLKQLRFKGNTAKLENVSDLKQKEKEIVDSIIRDSQTNDQATNDKIETVHLTIKYFLKGNSKQKDWMTLDEVENYLTSSKVNFTSNEVKAKVFIIDNPSIDDYGTKQFQLSSDEEAVTQEEEFSDKVQFKVYIYQTEPTDPTWIFKNKYLEGSEKKYTINGLSDWQKDINALKGLELEFNSVSDNGKPKNDKWSSTYNENYINKDKDYWIRFKVRPGFVFENALESDSKHSDSIKLDASRIKVTISLESSWLEQLVLSGNTKNLIINEDNVKKLVKDKLPNVPNKENLIKIQYTIDGQDWLTKDDFINKLNNLNGGLSETKWIILREDIKARFVIDKIVNNQFNPPYGLEISGIIVDDESKSPIVQLIDDNKNINSNVKGYINANKLTPLVASNFSVIGTNTKAFLMTKEVAKFNAMLDGYKSTNIFNILYSSEKNKFDQENKVWNPEKNGIVEKLALNGNFANKYIAINLKANSDKYDVYYDNEKQSDGYIISSPKIQVSLSIEIINPLIDKKVSITYINEQKQAIFYQNEGSFLFNINDNGQIMNFNNFINQLPTGSDTESGQYTQEMKQAMELVYYVSNHKLTSEEYNEVIKPSNIQKISLTNEKYGVWKSAPPILNDVANLKLSVNDYVIVALRIKPEFLSDSSKNESGFVMKDDKHTPTEQSRAHGYKVKTSEIEVDWNSIEIKNVNAPVNVDKGLDGFAVLNKLSLIEDAGKNYQGVSLRLNYFNDFYRDVNDKVLISSSGDRLVKRIESGEGIHKSDKPYYGIDGKPIKDNNGKEIYPYYDSQNRPSHPTKNENLTRSLQLSENENNIFSFYNKDGIIENNIDLIEYSLFANQYIEIEFMNKKGLSTEEGVYDYYVDQNNVTKNYTLPTSLIKFLVSNVNNIRYNFNSTEFKQIIADPNPSNVFVNNEDATKLPKNGKSKIKDNIMYKITRTGIGQNDIELTTLNEIRKQIDKDFSGQVKLQTSIRRKGSSWESAVDYGKIQNYTNLQNGDFIKVEIVPTNDEFVYAQQPEPLTFQITTLTIEDAPTNLFQWLRVEQVGDWDGEGSFRIYVDDPNNPNDDNLTIEDLSQGKYYFEVQVWGGVDPSTNKRIIKHKWTRDIDTINDLKNGDKVAWQLRSPEGTVSSAYFNTVADIANHNSSENKYSFVQINKKGLINITPPIPQPENGPIGPKPSDEDVYPEKSGFEIANLRIRDQDQEFTSISYNTFADLMKEMNFSYQGVNGNGNMISSKDPRNVIVDIEKPSSQLKGKRATTFTLQYLIDKGYLSFAYNTVGLSDFNRFSWNQVKDPSGNYLVAPGLLSNGDKVKAIYKDSTMSTAYEVQLNDVWGLSKKTDSMPMFAWVGIGVASVATLGIFAFIYFFARNRKLKVK